MSRIYCLKSAGFLLPAKQHAEAERIFSNEKNISFCLSVQVCGQLLDFDGCDAFKLLRDGGRIILRDVLLQGLGCAVDQILGFLEAKSGDFAYSLDGVDLVRASILQDDGEL